MMPKKKSTITKIRYAYTKTNLWLESHVGVSFGGKALQVIVMYDETVLDECSIVLERGYGWSVSAFNALSLFGKRNLPSFGFNIEPLIGSKYEQKEPKKLPVKRAGYALLKMS